MAACCAFGACTTNDLCSNSAGQLLVRPTCPAICGNVGLRKIRAVKVGSWRLHAKFEKFEVKPEFSREGDAQEQGEKEDNRDSVLPADLGDAVEQSAEATSQLLSTGGKRAIVEISVEELENFDTDGTQKLRWECSRLFVKSVQKRFQNRQVKAIFADMGTAAAIKYEWDDETIKFGSLSDRRPVSEEDDIIMLIAPDYQMLDEVQKIAYSLVDEDDMQHKPLIMWNPQLFSGDVGIGLNVRRVRNRFLSTFTTAYSLKALPMGALFKRYPGFWKLFVDDKQRPGRYLLICEQASKPSADEVDSILLEGSSSGSERGEPSLLANAMATISSFSRFIRSLSQ